MTYHTSDQLQTKKCTADIQAASSTMKHTLFFKQSSMGQNKLCVQQQKAHSHITVLNMTCPSALMIAYQN
jgi:hypothetical protein